MNIITKDELTQYQQVVDHRFNQVSDRLEAYKHGAKVRTKCVQANLSSTFKQFQEEIKDLKDDVKALRRRLKSHNSLNEQMGIVFNEVNCVKSNLEITLLGFKKELATLRAQHDEEAKKGSYEKPSTADSNDFMVHERALRSGHSWTKAEQDWLEAQYRTKLLNALRRDKRSIKNLGETVGDILTRLATINGRTEHALECRLEQLGYEVIT